MGLETTSLIPQTWREMRELRAALLKRGFKTVIAAIVDCAPVHFHTKLFRFVRTTQPVWFIGSANPGSERHELMIRINGRHEALSSYVSAVFEKAVDVARPAPDVEIRTLRDFFLSGFLCHKPPAQRLFTFNAYHFEPKHREQLSAALAGSSGVAHASPKAQGFGFNLRSALQAGNDPASFDSEEETAERVQFKRSSVDTVFGWWMPRVYAREIRDKVREVEGGRVRQLAAMGAALRNPEGKAAAQNALHDHVGSMQAFLKANDIHARPVQDRDSRFERFLSSRVRVLTDERTLRRLARSLTLAEMPDIWEDGRAVEEFQRSFFEDVAFRAGEMQQGRAVRSLLDWLDDDGQLTVSELEATFRSALKEEPWTDDCWED